VRGTLLLNPMEDFTVTIRADHVDAHGEGPVTKPIAINPASGAVTQIQRQAGLPATPDGRAQAVASYNAYATGVSHGFDDKNLNYPQSTDFQTTTLSMTMAADLTDNVSVKWITAYKHDKTQGSVDTDGTPFAILASTASGDIRQYTQELQLAGNLLSDRLQYTIGGYYFDVRKGNDVFSPALPLVSPTGPLQRLLQHHDTSSSAFGQASFAITDALKVTGGLRYTTEDKLLETRAHNDIACLIPPADQMGGACYGRYTATASDVSYTAGLDYKLTPDVMVYAKTSRGFKAGGINFGNQVPGSYTAYDPESVTDYEIGLKSEFWDRRVTFNVAAYRSDYTDIQRVIIVPNGSGGINSIVQNAAKARINGVEIETTILPIDGLRLNGSLAYTDPEYLDYVDAVGDHSAQKFIATPEWTYSLSAAYLLNTDFGTVGPQIDYSWRSRADLAPSAETSAPINHVQPGYGLLNARLQADFVDRNIMIALFAKNLTNKEYLASLSDLTAAVGYVTGYLGAPRTYGVEASMKF
jgi:iron complex outermembrane receptor protein